MSATVTKPAVKTIPILGGGEWVDVRAKRTADVFNPSTGAVIAKVPLCDAKQTGEVVETAARCTGRMGGDAGGGAGEGDVSLSRAVGGAF